MAMSSDLKEPLALLTCLGEAAEQPGAIIVMPPDAGAFIRGNRAGFIRLAIAALRAADGESVTFEKEEWVVDFEMDWGVKGLEYDALAHMDLPSPKPIGWRLFRQQLYGYVLLFFILGVFLAGLVSWYRIMVSLFRWHH